MNPHYNYYEAGNVKNNGKIQATISGILCEVTGGILLR